MSERHRDDERGDSKEEVQVTEGEREDQKWNEDDEVK